MSATACIGYLPSVVMSHNFIAHWAEQSMARENLDACASQNEHIYDWQCLSHDSIIRSSPWHLAKEIERSYEWLVIQKG
jgi:hypothetical protein